MSRQLATYDHELRRGDVLPGGLLQRSAVRQLEPAAVPQGVGEVLRSPGQPLDRATQTFFAARLGGELTPVQANGESGLWVEPGDSPYEREADRAADAAVQRAGQVRSSPGYDLSQVRVHTGLRAAESARALDAAAYTVGNHIIFGQGEYAPETAAGARLLAHELAHTVQQSQATPQVAGVIQRQRRVRFRRGTTIRSDPTTARRTFARIRESVQAYADNSLDYFSNQYRSAMTSFRLWYRRQPRADASFFNGVVSIIMNTAWAWGSPVVGAVVAPIGSIIMLVAQEATNAIQASRDTFADSLVRSANNFQASMQRRLSGKVPDILEQRQPDLWEDIQLRAYLGQPWQSLLHTRGRLPQRGVNYQTRLLTRLIYSYRRWEHSQHSASYRGIYSMADPYFEHMRGRAEAEAYLESGLAIPRRLGEYAHAGERVAR